MKKINEIFGYALFTIGASKILLMILILMKLTSNLSIIFNGGYADLNYYSTFSTVIGYLQIILAVSSVVMIILNIKNEPEVITGYLLGIGALVIELISPSIISFYTFFVECGMYMKAGSTIRKNNIGYDVEYRNTKKDIKNTEWFYNDKEEGKEYKSAKKRKINETNNKNMVEFIKENKNMILIMSGIVIVLLFVILIFCIIAKNDDDSDVAVAETKEIVMSDVTSSNINIEDEIDTQTVDKRLTKIANIFNKCNATKEMRSKGYTMNATVQNNTLRIYSNGDGLSFNVDFMLNDNILVAKIITNETDPRLTAIELTLAVILVDCVGQEKGYPDKKLSNALESEEGSNYNIKNEGVEIKQLNGGETIVVRVDLNSNFSFLNN